jgi:gluconate kinase
VLLILFGLPGAGKSFVGELLRDEFGFHLHEADDDIPDDYRRLVQAGHVVGDDRRDDYHRRLLIRIAALAAEHPKLAVAVPLLRQKHRDWLRARFPAAHFILVTCDPKQWEARLAGRHHTVNAGYARKVLPLYEPPALPHVVLDNTGDGTDSLRAQLVQILGALDNNA